MRYSDRVGRNGAGRRLGVVEAVAVLAVIAAVIAMAVWFVFFSSGGIGPGTV
jgi:hypothetical protein